MLITIILRTADGDRVLFRFLVLPGTATVVGNTAQWQTSPMAPAFSCTWEGEANVCTLQEFQQQLAAIVSFTPFVTITDNQTPKDCANLNFLLMPLSKRTTDKILVLSDQARIVNLTANGAPTQLTQKQVVVLAPREGGTIPLCLEAEALASPIAAEELRCLRSGVLQCPYSASLPSPGYWPVSTIFVRNSNSELLAACQFAIERFRGGTIPRLAIVSGDGVSSFLRDYYVNILHVDTDTGTQKMECLPTTKNGGAGWGGHENLGNVLVGPKQGSASGSSFGYGGNYLSCHIAGKPFLFFGGCGHQFGGHQDDRFMIGCIIGQLMQPITLVRLDTGWLKVGHVDEILSFPAPGVALIADPSTYVKLCPEKELPHEEVNSLVSKKLSAVRAFLSESGCKVVSMPAWFQPGGRAQDDLRHLTSVRGSAVNCIYLGQFSIHARSGTSKGSAEGPFEGTSATDRYVSEVMENLGFKALFVDMEHYNNEGGGGGNVHCCTFTTHLPPSRSSSSPTIISQSSSSSLSAQPQFSSLSSSPTLSPPSGSSSSSTQPPSGGQSAPSILSPPSDPSSSSTEPPSSGSSFSSTEERK